MQATSLIVFLIVVNVMLSGSGAENIFSEEAVTFPYGKLCFQYKIAKCQGFSVFKLSSK